MSFIKKLKRLIDEEKIEAGATWAKTRKQEKQETLLRQRQEQEKAMLIAEANRLLKPFLEDINQTYLNGKGEIHSESGYCGRGEVELSWPGYVLKMSLDNKEIYIWAGKNPGTYLEMKRHQMFRKWERSLENHLVCLLKDGKCEIG